MKTDSRSILLIVMALTLSGLSFSKMAEPIDNDQISKIVQEKIDEKNYTRIPNDDFDNLVGFKIAKILDDKLSSWLTLIGAFLALVGGLVTVAMNKFLNDAVTKNVKSTITEKSKELENIIDTKNREIESELQAIQEYINANKSILYEMQLKKFTEDSKINPTSEKLTSKMEDLLENVSEIGDSDLFSKTFDQLVNFYYTQRKDKKIDSLLDRYSGKENISYSTFFNAALPHFNSYELTSSNAERNKALEYLDKSLEVEPTYGVALAVKLELFMMDYLKEKTDLSQKHALDHADQVFTQALSTMISSNEAAKRLKTDKTYPQFSKYIELLSRFFADKMAELELKARLNDEYNQASDSNDRNKMEEIRRQFEGIGSKNLQDIKTILKDNQNHQSQVE